MSRLFIFLAIAHIPLIYIKDQSIGLFDLFIAIYLIYMIIIKVKKRINVKKNTLLFVLYISYVIINMLTIGSTGIESVALLFKFIQYAIIYIIALDIFKNINREELPNLISISVITVALYGIWQLYFTGNWYRLGLPGMIGVSSNPGGFVTGLNLIVVVYLLLAGKHKKQERILNIMVVVSVYSIYMTYSRTNQLSVIITLLIMFIIRYKEVEKKYLQVVIVLLVIVGTTFYLANSNFNTKSAENIFIALLDPGESILNDSSFQARTIAWQKTFEDYTSSIINIIFGLGFGNIGATDSFYLRVLYNNGIIGLLLVFILLISLFGSLRKNTIMNYIIVYITINGIASETLYSSYRSVQYFIIIIALIKITSKQDDKYLYHRSHI